MGPPGWGRTCFYRLLGARFLAGLLTFNSSTFNSSSFCSAGLGFRLGEVPEGSQLQSCSCQLFQACECPGDEGGESWEPRVLAAPLTCQLPRHSRLGISTRKRTVVRSGWAQSSFATRSVTFLSTFFQHPPTKPHQGLLAPCFPLRSSLCLFT